MKHALIVAGRNGHILAALGDVSDVLGWDRTELIGELLSDTIIPQRYRVAHIRGIVKYQATGEGRLLGQRAVVPARAKSGTDHPIFLTVFGRSENTGHYYALLERTSP